MVLSLTAISLLLFLIRMLPAHAQNDCSLPSESILNEGPYCCKFADKMESKVLDQCMGSNSRFCLMECMFNKTNILENDEIQIEKVKTTLERELKVRPEFIPIIIKAAQECYTIAKNIIKAGNDLMDGCHEFPLILYECTYTKTFVQCPSNQWKSSSACDQIKSFFTKCPLPSIAALKSM